MFLAIALAVESIIVGQRSAMASTPPATVPSAGNEQGINPQIAAQITRLGDPDPAVRRLAADGLRQLGAPGRPAVLQAARGDDPQIAEEASQVLRSLPWSVPTDPPQVRVLLATYGHATSPDRIGILTQISEQPGGQACLLRLLNEELNEDVSWQIERLLLQKPQRSTFTAAREFDPGTSRPSALSLAAHAWLTPGVPVTGPPPNPALAMIAGASKFLTGQQWPQDVDLSAFDSKPMHRATIDRSKGLAFLSRAVQLESANPTDDGGQLDFAFDVLCAAAIENERPDQAAQLRRQQCTRIGVTRDGYPAPFFELMALHAEFGPLAGLDDDLQMGDAYLSHPESLYALGRIYDRLGRSVEAQSLYQLALSAGPSSDSRLNVSSFLMDHAWTDLAARECRATLARGEQRPDKYDQHPDRYDVNAHLQLSALAAARGDEGGAAEEMRIALDENKNSGGELNMRRGVQQLRGDEAEHALQIEAAVHALHAAQSNGNDAVIVQRINELMRLGPDNAEAVLDLVPELKAHGRGDEAAKLFAAAYVPLRARMDSGENDPSLLNEVAWLCARCDERLDEAVALSNRAVAAEPDEAAYLDTNAEAHFRIGQAAEAERLETLALKHRPADKFMQGQLARFRAGKR